MALCAVLRKLFLLAQRFSLAGNWHGCHPNELLGARVEAIPQMIKGTSAQTHSPGTKTYERDGMTRQALYQDPSAAHDVVTTIARRRVPGCGALNTFGSSSDLISFSCVTRLLLWSLSRYSRILGSHNPQNNGWPCYSCSTRERIFDQLRLIETLVNKTRRARGFREMQVLAQIFLLCTVRQWTLACKIDIIYFSSSLARPPLSFISTWTQRLSIHRLPSSINQRIYLFRVASKTLDFLFPQSSVDSRRTLTGLHCLTTLYRTRLEITGLQGFTSGVPFMQSVHTREHYSTPNDGHIVARIYVPP